MRNLVGKDLLERYHVEEHLFSSDLADIYRVWDNKSMMPLVIKVFNEEFSGNETFINQLDEEVKTLCSLQHPNIVRVYGKEQSGSLVFLVMDFVDGDSLGNILQNRSTSLKLEEISYILRAIKEALTYAGTHGAISPSSIFIDKLGRVQICDFETSRLRLAAGITNNLSQNHYLAPEQKLNGDISPGSDVYSLGILLCQFLGGNGLSFVSEDKILIKLSQENLNTFREKNPEILQRLEEILSRSLNPDPLERYATVSEFVETFEKALGDKQDYAVLSLFKGPDNISPASEIKEKKEEYHDVPGWVIGSVLVIGFILIIFMFWNFSGIFRKEEVQTNQVSAVELTQTSLLATTVAELMAVQQQQIIPISGDLQSTLPLPTDIIEMDTATPQATPTIFNGVRGVVLWPSVNVRTGPGTNFEIADYLFEGDEIIILGKNGDFSWAMFMKNGEEFWIARTVFEVEEGLELIPLIETPPPPNLVFTPTSIPDSNEKPAPTATQMPQPTATNPPPTETPMPQPTATDPPPPTPTEDFSTYP